ncbi:MAG: hypothetical protein QOG45_2620 [Chloroflexota bacterium]|jgi:hypothetical protein|nr:hypothetical protein [Chloroflexota bacterium]
MNALSQHEPGIDGVSLPPAGGRATAIGGAYPAQGEGAPQAAVSLAACCASTLTPGPMVEVSVTVLT